ncbi:MAG: DUF4249 family protein [Cytophagales bacterium]
MKHLFYILIAIALLSTACEDPYDIDIEKGESQLVVDAFINNDAAIKEIILTETVDFFDANQPPAVRNAEVAIFNLNSGLVYNFTENQTKPGHYQWSDSTLPILNRIGDVGDTLNLAIVNGTDTFISASVLKRTTAIDSVIFVFEEGNSFTDEGYYAELKASDLPGTGDIYWIRSWVNGIYLSKAVEINVAYDASFTPGASSDGIPFILPIRTGINPINDDEDEERSDPDQYVPETPYEIGDSIYVEIWSINESTIFFLQQIQAEVNNGGLFATPPTNVRTNIFNINPNSEKAAVGHFCVSEVSSGGAKLNP